MKEIFTAESELTGKLESASVMPTLISEIDGKLIVDGVADIDLLNQYDLMYDEHGVAMPAPLCENGKRLELKDSQRMIKAWNKRNARRLEKRNAYRQHLNRIRENEFRWHGVCDDDVEPELIQAVSKILLME